MFLISCIACLTVQWEPQSMWGGRGSPLRTWNYGGRHFMAPASDGWLTLGMFVFVSLAAGCVHLLCSWRWTCFLAVDTLILHFTTFPPSKIWLGSFISEISLSNVRVLTVWRGLSCLTPASFYRRLPRWRKLYFCLVSIQRITFSVAKPLSENFTNANSWFIPAVILMPMVISCGRYCIIFPVFTVVKWGGWDTYSGNRFFCPPPWCSASSPKCAYMGTWRESTPCISPERFAEVCIPTCRQTTKTPPGTGICPP